MDFVVVGKISKSVTEKEIDLVSQFNRNVTDVMKYFK